MIACLLWNDKNKKWNKEKDPLAEDRFRDLKLDRIVTAMGGGDPQIMEICRKVVDMPLDSVEAIGYRQEILKDCIQNPETIESIYKVCADAEENRKNTWCRLTSPHLTSVYSSAEDLLKIYLEALLRIRRTLETKQFYSQGLQRFSRLLTRELSDPYIEEIRNLQSGIVCQDGMLVSAGFGPYLQGVSYVKRLPEKGLGRIRWMFQPSYTLGDRDMKGAKDLEMRQDRAINEVANVMAQAAESLRSLVDELREELAFYMGGIHLWRALEEYQERLCFPILNDGEERSYDGIYDGTMALAGERKIIGNTVRSQDRSLWLLTGANQGGKTTFLRSIGIAQVMAQCGLFVFAESCQIPVRRQIFTHFEREEDRKGKSGKLDEEFGRMSNIVDRIGPGDMLLSNESFSSTNDRDGSEIFLGIVRGLMDSGVEIFTVTHLMDFAIEMARKPGVLSLRPERKKTGERTYQLMREAPRPDAYAEDIYREIFESDYISEIT